MESKESSNVPTAPTPTPLIKTTSETQEKIDEEKVVMDALVIKSFFLYCFYTKYDLFYFFVSEFIVVFWLLEAKRNPQSVHKRL